MKKFMILTIALLSIAVVNLSTIQPVKGQSTVGCEHIGGDRWGCNNYYCPSGCVVFICPNSDPEGPPEVDQTC